MEDHTMLFWTCPCGMLKAGEYQWGFIKVHTRLCAKAQAAAEKKIRDERAKAQKEAEDKRHKGKKGWAKRDRDLRGR